jgi:hypothetical protein
MISLIFDSINSVALVYTSLVVTDIRLKFFSLTLLCLKGMGLQTLVQNILGPHPMHLSK